MCSRTCLLSTSAAQNVLTGFTYLAHQFSQYNRNHPANPPSRYLPYHPPLPRYSSAEITMCQHKRSIPVSLKIAGFNSDDGSCIWRHNMELTAVSLSNEPLALEQGGNDRARKSSCGSQRRQLAILIVISTWLGWLKPPVGQIH
ncbi:hypothetical protein IF2G_08600 [Cordyceps javanica]|nr:hypothetical protein IF2G_08600 [Cordyceps javanica]